MNIHEALVLAKYDNRRVRPVVWQSINRRHWIEARTMGDHTFFVECGDLEEIPHMLVMQYDTEFLGEWEVMP